jgi:outer membrane protein
MTKNVAYTYIGIFIAAVRCYANMLMNCSRVLFAMFAAVYLGVLGIQKSASAAIDLAPLGLRPAAPSSHALTIEETVSTALIAYPQIRVRVEQSQAARERILLTREQEYIPKALSTWEEVAASHNKQTQILFGDPVFPANPGPGLPYQTWRGNWFSGAGMLLDWNPIDFGLHRARIDVAKSEFEQSRNQTVLTQLDVSTMAANAFLDLVIGQEQVKAAQANVKRMEVLRNIVSTMVSSGLRPGVDLSLAEAELADIRNTLIIAEQKRKILQARLAESVGRAGTEILIDPTPVEQKEEPPTITVSLDNYSAHPLSVAQRSVIGTLEAQDRVFSKSAYPTIRFLAGLNWRGSGLDIHGKFQKQDAFGLWPRAYNWNVGMVMNWGFLDWIQLHQQRVVQAHLIQSQRAQYALIIEKLKSEDQQSRAMLEGAIELARNMPIQTKAATDAELRARTRYGTGLASIAEVADAERLLARAEVQDAVAKVGVWKALLAISNARGSVDPFLKNIAAARASGGF